MRRNLIIVILVYLCNFAIYANEAFRSQSSINCTNIPHAGQQYAPAFIPSEVDPIMTVRINLIFIQKNDGTGNFQENDTAHQLLLDDAISILNEKVSTLQIPGPDCYAGTTSDFVHDIRMRFVDHRFYIRNSSAWDNNLSNSNTNLCPPYDPTFWYLDAVDYAFNDTLSDGLRGINVYFTEDSTMYNRCWEIQNLNDTSAFNTDLTTGCSDFPLSDNLQKSLRIHMPCLFSKYWWTRYIVPQLASENYTQWYHDGKLLMAGTIATGLVHELGHALNLDHPRLDVNHVIYPDKDCMETIMQPSQFSPRNFLPPSEIGKMYFATMTTNLQQFIPSDTYLGTKTINTTLSLPRMRMYYSLLIGSSGNVTMPCDMTFSPQGYIQVDNGGVLTVDNASLHSVQGDWEGIIVQSGGQLNLSDVTVGDYNIVVKSGGCLIVNDDLTVAGDHSITIEAGGYLCVSTSASINLQDAFSRILISPNAILGCPSCNETCISSRSSLSNTGNGHFITYEGTDYLQNITITSDYMATGNNVMAGYDVTNTKPVGSVIVENGGELRIKANETTLTKDVEVKLGGTLEISK